uniref:Voltage-gated hydrogen channel 1 n=1 Tax=Mycena chlorophos TaxID=658473 RepID=A0ABQ0L7Z2_MYCCL|nr:predicted protein [Mycena chlorophos]
MSSPNSPDGETSPLLPSPPKQSLRKRTGEFLESTNFHRFVISLITIDAACVLADLAYAFLHESCTPVEGPNAPQWLDVLAHISLFITGVFILEIPLTLWGIGIHFYVPGYVPHAGLHLFDAVIVCATFVLEVVLRGKEQELAGLLVVLRLWRLIKLVGGVSVGVGEMGEQDAIRAAEAEQEVARLKRENADLKALLVEAGVQ